MCIYAEVMDQQTVIEDIEARASRNGISIRALCMRANVHPGTFSRWKRTDRNPEPVGANLHSIGRLYAAIDEIVAERDELPKVALA